MQTASSRRVFGVLMVAVVMTAGCGSSQSSSSPEPVPSGAVTPSASPARPAASTAPTLGPDGPLVNAIVITVSADLRVRSQPRVSDDSVKYEPVLPLGTKLHVLDGPVLDSGYVWYKVQPVAFSALEGPGFGWIAIADHDGTPWVEIAKAEPTPKPAGFAWAKPAPASIPDDALYVDGPRLAHTPQGYALLTSSGADLWFSTDARHWKFGNARGTPGADTEIEDVGAGDLGFVAVGHEYLADSDDEVAVALTSSDGRRWQQASDPTFAGAEMDLVGVGRQAIVAFDTNGRGGLMWASRDGTDWARVTTQGGIEVARGVHEVVAADGRLTAFVSVPGKKEGVSLRVDVWQTDNGADWWKVAELPKSKGADVESAAIGGGRWIAWGWGPDRPVAWTSGDGVDWKRVTLPEGKDSPGPTDVIAYAGGYVAVFVTGGPSNDTCGPDLSGPFVTTTWTSSDGRTWHKRPSPRGVGVKLMVAVDGGIVGVGQTFSKTGKWGLVAVAAALPASLADASWTSPGDAKGSPEDVPTVGAIRSSPSRIGACGP